MGILFIPIATRIGATAGNKISAIDLNGLVRHWLTGPGKLLILVMVLYNLSLIAILSMTPLYLQSEHGLTPFNAGLIFATMLLIGTIFQPFAGKYTDRRGRKPLIVITLIMSSLFAILAGLGSGLGWVVTGLLPAAALLTSIRPVVLAAAVDYSGKSEATTLGIVFTVLDGVAMLGALFAGLIGEFSLNYAFLLAAGFAMASALICMLLSFEFHTPSSFRPLSRNSS